MVRLNPYAKVVARFRPELVDRANRTIAGRIGRAIDGAGFVPRQCEGWAAFSQRAVETIDQLRCDTLLRARIKLREEGIITANFAAESINRETPLAETELNMKSNGRESAGCGSGLLRDG